MYYTIHGDITCNSPKLEINEMSKERINKYVFIQCNTIGSKNKLRLHYIQVGMNPTNKMFNKSQHLKCTYYMVLGV